MATIIAPSDVFSHFHVVDADFTFVAATDASGVVSGFDAVSFGNINKQNWALFWLIWAVGAVDCDSIEFELKIEGVETDGLVYPPYVQNPTADATFSLGTMQFQNGQNGAVLENPCDLIYTAIDGKFKVKCLGLPTISFDRIKCEISYINE